MAVGTRRIEGTGRRLENETVICWNDGEDVALVNTASPSVFNRLIKKGFLPSYSNGNRARFEIPKNTVKLPAPKRKLSAEKSKALSDRMKANRERG